MNATASATQHDTLSSNSRDEDDGEIPPTELLDIRASTV